MWGCKSIIVTPSWLLRIPCKLYDLLQITLNLVKISYKGQWHILWLISYVQSLYNRFRPLRPRNCWQWGGPCVFVHTILSDRKAGFSTTNIPRREPNLSASRPMVNCSKTDTSEVCKNHPVSIFRNLSMGRVLQKGRHLFLSLVSWGRLSVAIPTGPERVRFAKAEWICRPSCLKGLVRNLKG